MPNLNLPPSGQSPQTVIVSTRNALPASISGGSGTKTRGESRITMQNGPDPMFDLRLVFGNFYTAGDGDLNGAQAISVEAAIETANGTVRAMFANGVSTSVVISVAGVVVSDPVAVELAPFETFWVRTGVIVTAGQAWPGTRNTFGATGDGSFESTSGTGQVLNTGVMTMPSPNGATADTNAYTPLAVLGSTHASPMAVYIAGDGHAEGVGDTGLAGSGHFGYIARALGTHPIGPIPFVRMCRQAEEAQDVVGIKSLRRRQLMQYATHGICDLGQSDIINGRTFAQVTASLSAVWSAMRTRGLNVTQVLIMPATTSSDSFATETNQTHRTGFAPAGIRDQVNAWILSQRQAGVIDHVINPNTGIESVTNPGKWRVGSAFTNDGREMLPAAHILAAGAVTRWISRL